MHGAQNTWSSGQDHVLETVVSSKHMPQDAMVVNGWVAENSPMTHSADGYFYLFGRQFCLMPIPSYLMWPLMHNPASGEVQ